MNEGIANGEVQPLPWTVFSRSKPQDAFRYLAGGDPQLFGTRVCMCFLGLDAPMSYRAFLDHLFLRCVPCHVQVHTWGRFSYSAQILKGL